MFSTAKKIAFVGLGLSGRMKEVLDTLVTKGEENQSKEALRVKSLITSLENRFEHRKDELDQKMSSLCNRVVNKVSLPSKGDFNRLEKELQTLSAQFRQWEEGKQNKPGASSSTS